ncbi:thyrotropin-releasing hormone receptor-like [Babylonia areolata]|uniref:thyrotropin-releasing hormone receptor-like n=1 Tax=Babylonia areolata TaxID=304850 RepID=UPI003FD2522D
MADMSVNVLSVWNATPTPSPPPPPITLDIDIDIDIDSSINKTHWRPYNNFSHHRPPRGPPPGVEFMMTMFKTLCDCVLQVQCYGDPIVFVVGLLSNLLTYLVFTRSRFRKVPSVPYLSGIAVADTGFLCTYFLNTLTYIYGYPIMSQKGLCQYGMFANYVFLFLSVWYTVAAMVEKFIAVYWPLKKGALCTVFRAKVVLVSLAVMAIVSYSYVIYFFGPDPRYGMCKPWQEFQDPYQILMVLDCIIVFIAPLLVLITLILLIIIRNCEYYRISSATENGPTTTTTESTLRNKSPSSQNSLQATEMVSALVGVVLVTHLPNSVVRVLGFFTTQMNIEKTLLMKISSVVRQVHLVSFALKLFVYLAVSRRYRKHTQKLLCCGKECVVSVCRCGSPADVDPQRISLRDHGPGQPAVNTSLMQSDV